MSFDSLDSSDDAIINEVLAGFGPRMYPLGAPVPVPLGIIGSIPLYEPLDDMSSRYPYYL